MVSEAAMSQSSIGTPFGGWASQLTIYALNILFFLKLIYFIYLFIYLFIGGWPSQLTTYALNILFFFLLTYVFIFGCVGSSLLHAGFL